MKSRLGSATLAMVLGAILLLAPAAQAGEFPLKAGDVIVMAGDSITAQHLHTNYIEAYCVTRFPKWNLQFRNAGVGGDRASSVLARLDADVLFWPPTVVTIELGMNDANKAPQDITPYVGQMRTLIGRIRAAGARPVLITASPVNDGSTSDALKPHNAVLDRMAAALVELAAKENLPCADQFHPLLDLWARNQKSPDAVPLGGDAVHPGPVSQMAMAYFCLVGLGAPAVVSEATLDNETAKVVSAENCVITDVTRSGGVLTFRRADECLPMPVPKPLQPALQLVPLSEKLNRYMLTVKGLTWPKYSVSIDGLKVAAVSRDELAAGWNMSTLTDGPIAVQCQSVMDLIGRKAKLVSVYRDAKRRPQQAAGDAAANAAADAKFKEDLERLNKAVLAASTEINAAAQPKPHRFEIEPAN